MTLSALMPVYAHPTAAGTVEDTALTPATPHCVEKTEELLSNDLIKKVSDILDKELSEIGGHTLIKDGKHMTISDCGFFHTIVLLPPPKDGARYVIIDGFITIFFFDHQFLPPFEGRYEVVIH